MNGEPRRNLDNKGKIAELSILMKLLLRHLFSAKNKSKIGGFGIIRT